MSLSPNAVKAANAQETEEAFLLLLTISHASLSVPIRVVDNSQNVTSRGNLFVAYPFELDLPDDAGEGGLPRVTLTIDNVSHVDEQDAQQRRISDYLRAIDSAFTATIEVVLASSPDTVEYGPLVLTATEAQYDALKVEAELAWEDVLNEPFPGDSFIPSQYPGLF